MTLPAWDKITTSEEWKKLSDKDKRTVYQGYLSDLGDTDAWKSLGQQEKLTVVDAIMKDAGFSAPVEDVSAVDKTGFVKNITDFYGGVKDKLVTGATNVFNKVKTGLKPVSAGIPGEMSVEEIRSITEAGLDVGNMPDKKIGNNVDQTQTNLSSAGKIDMSLYPELAPKDIPLERSVEDIRSMTEAGLDFNKIPVSKKIYWSKDHENIFEKNITSLNKELSGINSDYDKLLTDYNKKSELLTKTGAEIKRLRATNNQVDIEKSNNLVDKYNNEIESLKEIELFLNNLKSDYDKKIIKYNDYLKIRTQQTNEQAIEDSRKIPDPILETVKAIPPVVTAVAGPMAAMPGAGIEAAAQLLPRISADPDKLIDLGSLEDAQAVLDKRLGAFSEFITTPEQAQAVENIGLASKPFEMAGEGWRLIGAGINNVLKDPNVDPNIDPIPILEPFLASLGEISAVMGLPEILKKLKAMPPEQRALVTKEIADTVASEGLTEAELLRKLGPNSDLWKAKIRQQQEAARAYAAESASAEAMADKAPAANSKFNIKDSKLKAEPVAPAAAVPPAPAEGTAPFVVKETAPVIPPVTAEAPIKPAPVIPEFKDSEEAIAFGMKASPEELARIKELQVEFDATALKLVGSGNTKDGQVVGQMASFMREAIEANANPERFTESLKKGEERKAEKAGLSVNEVMAKELEKAQKRKAEGRSQKSENFIESEDVYNEIRKNEGKDAEKLVRSLNRNGVITVDTHVKDNYIRVQVAGNSDILNKIANTGVLLTKNISQKGIDESYRMSIDKNFVDDFIKEIEQVEEKPAVAEAMAGKPIPTKGGEGPWTETKKSPVEVVGGKEDDSKLQVQDSKLEEKKPASAETMASKPIPGIEVRSQKSEVSEKPVPMKEAESSKVEAEGEEKRVIFLNQIAEKYVSLAQADGKIMPFSIANKNAQNLYNVIENRVYSDIVHPDNKLSRKIFEEVTGEKLPAGVKATQDYFTQSKKQKKAVPEKAQGIAQSVEKPEIKTREQFEEEDAIKDPEIIKLGAEQVVRQIETEAGWDGRDITRQYAIDKAKELSKIDAKTLQNRIKKSGGTDREEEGVGRSVYLAEATRRGIELLKQLGWPTEPESMYRHIRTGEEETLTDLTSFQNKDISSDKIWRVVESHEPAIGINTTLIKKFEDSIKQWENFKKDHPRTFKAKAAGINKGSVDQVGQPAQWGETVFIDKHIETLKNEIKKLKAKGEKTVEKKPIPMKESESSKVKAESGGSIKKIASGEMNPDDYEFPENISPFEINKAWDDFYSEKEAIDEKNAPEIKKLNDELGMLKLSKESVKRSRKKEIQDRIDELKSESEVVIAVGESAFISAQEKIAQRIYKKISDDPAFKDVTEEDVFDAIAAISDGRFHDTVQGSYKTWNQPLEKQVIEYLKPEEINQKLEVRSQESEASSKPIPMKEAESSKVKGGSEEKKQIHDYSNTQVLISGEIAKEIVDFGNRIPDTEIYTNSEAGYESGREKEPHITVRYGLATDDVIDLKKAFKDTPPIKAKLGKISIFESEDHDVVKVDIDSPELIKANKIVGDTVDLPGETFKDYKPHATIAYVKKGEGKKYVGDSSFEGKEITFDKLQLSTRTGKMIDIPLNATPAKDIVVKGKGEETQDISALEKEIKDKEDNARRLQGNKKGAWGRITAADKKRSQEISSLKEKLNKLKSKPAEEKPVGEKVKIEDVVIEDKGREKVVKTDLTKKEADKLSLKEQKQYLIAEIDKAIEQAPEDQIMEDRIPEKSLPDEDNRTFIDRSTAIIDKNIEKFVIIEIPGDGKYRIINSRKALEQFKKNASQLALEYKPETSKPLSKKSMPYKKEEIGEIVTINDMPDWFTDYNLLIKSKIPKNASLSANPPINKKDVERYLDRAEKSTTAKFLYYAIDNPDIGQAISERPIRGSIIENRKISTKAEYRSAAIFELDGKKIAYNQDKFNAIKNRYPDAEYKIEDKPAVEREGSMLFAIQDGKPVAMLAPLQMAEESYKLFDKLISEKETQVLQSTQLEEKPKDIKKPIPTKKAESSKVEVERETASSEAPKSKPIPGKKSSAVGGSASYGGDPDVGGYATNIKYVLELPELVRLARDLMDGKYPQIKKNLGKYAGMFYHSGKIAIKADVFRNEKQVAAVLAHEIGHLVDWLPDKDMKKGNILGRIASLHNYLKKTLPQYPGAPDELTTQDRSRLRYQAQKMAKAQSENEWIDEIIKKELPIEPQDVLNIWNAVDVARAINPDLYEYVARLSTAQKKAVVKDALQGVVRDELKQFAKVIEEKTGKQIKQELSEEEFKKLVSQKYKDLINEEIKKRRLFDYENIMEELKDLTRIWKPFDPVLDPKYTKYRYSAKELYADAFSALLNAPGFLKAAAPNFYEALFNYMENKPEVKRHYEDLQAKIASGEIESERIEEVYKMFKNGDEAYALSLDKESRFYDAVMRDFVDLAHMVLKKVRKVGERNIPAAENPRYKLEEMNYSGSEIEWLLTRVKTEIMKPLDKASLTWDDFGVELYLRRVKGDRSGIANPQGWTARLAEKKIEELKRLRTAKQNTGMEEAIKAFQDLRTYVIDKAEKTGRWDDEIIKMMRNDMDYATFDVIKYIEKRYGAGPSAKIYPQVGTFNEISNPATATIMKDISILKAINRGVAAESVTKFFKMHFPNEIKPAETKWNGKFQEIQPPDRGSGQGLIVYLKNGKPEGYYVDEWVADIFEKNPIEGHVISKVLGWLAQPFRTVFTEINPGFALFNVIRDYKRSVKNLPGSSLLNFVKYYNRSIKPSFKSVYGVPDSVVDEMLKGNMLISIADFRGQVSEDKQIDRLLKMYHLEKAKWEKGIVKPFGFFFHYLSNINRAIERIPKVAGYQFLKEKHPDLPDEVVGHMVRNIGSPAFLNRGRWYPIYNNFFLFSNAMKEGYRGDYEAMAKKPGEWWWKTAKYVFLPKLLMMAGTFGLLGAAIKLIYKGVSDYDQANFIIIPLGLTPTGKSVILRIPSDETGRLLGGILWKATGLQKKETITDLLDYMAGQVPTVSPAIENLAAVVQYASGKNPYDSFYGSYAIPEQIFEAGGARSHKAFLKWMLNNSGAGIVYRFKNDDVDSVKGELEEILGYPIASNIIGRFIKVTDRGLKETIEADKQMLKKLQAQENLAVKDALAKSFRDEELTDEEIQLILNKVAKSPEMIDRNMMTMWSRKYGQMYMEEFITAQTKEQKAAVLNRMLERDNLLEKAGIESKPIPMKENK